MSPSIIWNKWQNITPSLFSFSHEAYLFHCYQCLHTTSSLIFLYQIRIKPFVFIICCMWNIEFLLQVNAIVMLSSRSMFPRQASLLCLYIIFNAINPLQTVPNGYFVRNIVWSCSIIELIIQNWSTQRENNSFHIIHELRIIRGHLWLHSWNSLCFRRWLNARKRSSPVGSRSQPIRWHNGNIEELRQKRKPT